MVSTPTIITMFIVVAALVAVPVAVLILFARKVTMNLSTVFLGLIMFVGFDTILLGLFDSVVMSSVAATLYDYIHANELAFVIYYSFMRAFVYTVGLYTMARMSMRSDTNGGGIALGIGAGATRCILGGAWIMITNISTSFKINKDGLDTLLAGESADKLEALKTQASTLLDATPLDIFHYCAESILMLFVFLAAGVIIHIAATHRGSILLMYLCMALMLIVFAIPAMYQVGYLTNPGLYEIILAGATAIIGGTAIWIGRKYMLNPMKY